jgi:hypothetical protein
VRDRLGAQNGFADGQRLTFGASAVEELPNHLLID